MAFTEITEGEIAVDAPVKASTHDKFRTNEDYLNEERRKWVALYWATLTY